MPSQSRGIRALDAAAQCTCRDLGSGDICSMRKLAGRRGSQRGWQQRADVFSWFLWVACCAWHGMASFKVQSWAAAPHTPGPLRQTRGSRPQVQSNRTVGLAFARRTRRLGRWRGIVLWMTSWRRALSAGSGSSSGTRQRRRRRSSWMRRGNRTACSERRAREPPPPRPGAVVGCRPPRCCCSLRALCCVLLQQ